MIYVGIGSLQCSGEVRDMFPIMMDSVGNITLVNTRINTSWHMRTTRDKNVFWIGPLYNYQDDHNAFAMKKLMDLKKEMRTNFDGKPETNEDD